MALGKRCGSTASEGLGFGVVRYTRSMSGKRVGFSSNMEVDSTITSPPLKRQCSLEMMIPSSEKSLLEALPQDILIRVLCGVGHDDLKQLFHVSKQIREATKIAKQWHFAYSTPKKVSAFRNPIDLGDFEELGTPNAPKQCRSRRPRLSGKKLADISVALFASPAEGDQWPRRDLFMEMETEA